jgi:hypothetical protein
MKLPVSLLYRSERSLKSTLVIARNAATHESSPVYQRKARFSERLDDGGSSQVQSFQEFCACNGRSHTGQKPDEDARWPAGPAKALSSRPHAMLPASLRPPQWNYRGSRTSRRAFPCWSVWGKLKLNESRRNTPTRGLVMSTAPRILAVSVSLTAILAVSAGPTEAADWAGQPPLVAKAESGAPRWRARILRSRCELVEGVRGATPLTVPFFGYGWYPGPARYYGQCWRDQGGPAISVKY